MAASDPVARIRRAASAKRRADLEYRAALAAALEAGVSYADVARAADTSRQRVRQWAGRNT